jgi:hypothetical protein
MDVLRATDKNGNLQERDFHEKKFRRDRTSLWRIYFQKTFDEKTHYIEKILNEEYFIDFMYPLRSF